VAKKPRLKVVEGGGERIRERAERFLRLFAGNESHYGTHGEPILDPVVGVKWEIKPTASTRKGPTTLRMWEDHLAGRRPLGVVPIRDDDTCVWGSIDVDDYDVSPVDVASRIEKARLPLVPSRSKSGGLHLLLFSLEPVAAALMQSTLRDVAASLGFSGSEIFPKQTRILADSGEMGSWIVMPYLGTTYGGKIREQCGIKRTGAEMTVDEFLDIAERSRVDISAISVARASARGKGRERPPFSDGPPCLVHMCSLTEGIVQGGQNNALFHMGVYFKRKHPEDWQKRLEEANQKFCRPPYPTDKLSITIKSLNKKDYQYKCKDQPMASHCDAMQCRGRKFGVGAGGTYPQITGLSKLDTEPPLWFVDVEGAKIAMSTEDLQMYPRFHRLCIENVHKSFAIITQNVWYGVLNEALQNLTLIPAPDDAGIGGQFRELLEAFLTNRQRGRAREDLVQGRPWEDEESGRHYFQLSAFARFLDREGMRDMAKSRGQITSRIEKLGGGWIGLTIKGAGFRNFWWVPGEILRRDEPAAVPRIEGGDM
jgi:hypothetical protein